MSEEITMSNIELFNSLLETDVDNIEDLPEFETFVPGEYNLKCTKMEVKMDESKDSAQIVAYFSNLGNLNPEEYSEDVVLPTEGALMSQRWSGEFGIKIFKKTFLSCIQDLNCSNIVQFIEQAADMEFACYVGNRKDKEKVDEAGEPVKYNDLRTAVLA